MPFEKGKSGNPEAQFQRGQSGNPDGMPKGTRHLSTLLREALESGVDVEVNGKTLKVDEAELIKQVASGIAKGNIKFIEMAFDRIDGKAAQSMEVTGKDGAPIEHTHSLSPEDIKTFKSIFNQKYK